MLTNHIEKYRPIATKVSFLSPKYVPIDISLRIIAQQGFKDVEKIIYNELKREVDGVNGEAEFGKGVFYGELYSKLENLECVKQIESLEFFSSSEYAHKDSKDNLILAEFALGYLNRFDIEINNMMMGIRKKGLLAGEYDGFDFTDGNIVKQPKTEYCSYISKVLDSYTNGSEWGRLVLKGTLPKESEYVVYTLAQDYDIINYNNKNYNLSEFVADKQIPAAEKFNALKLAGAQINNNALGDFLYNLGCNGYWKSYPANGQSYYTGGIVQGVYVQLNSGGVNKYTMYVASYTIGGNRQEDIANYLTEHWVKIVKIF